MTLTIDTKKPFGLIPLAAAIESVFKLIDTKDWDNHARRAEKNRIRLRISHAKEQGIFKRKCISNDIYLPEQQFRFWAIRAWPELKLQEAFNLPERALVNLTPDYGLVFFPPRLDRDSEYIPDDHDELKELYLCALQELMTAKLGLLDCRTKLAEFVERDAVLRQKKSDGGKKGGRGRTK